MLHKMSIKRIISNNLLHLFINVKIMVNCENNFIIDNFH